MNDTDCQLAAASAADASAPGRLRRVLREEVGGLQLRWRMVQALVRLIPSGTGLRLRARLYGLAGLRIGRGTVLSGALQVSGAGCPAERLHIGRHCYLNERIAFNLGGDVFLELPGVADHPRRAAGAGVCLDHHPGTGLSRLAGVLALFHHAWREPGPFARHPGARGLAFPGHGVCAAGGALFSWGSADAK